MNRKERAVELHKKGYNCAQAVFCTFCDIFGIEEETAFKISQGFGGGMGGMQDGTCGAVSGMYMLAGFLYEGKTKAEVYGLVQKMAKDFKEMNKTTICKELKGTETGVAIRSCDGCIEDAVEIAEKYCRELIG